MAFPSDIGRFVIGESPIEGEDDTILDLLTTVISQYANSPVLLGILQTFNQAEDPKPNIDEFYNKVWNIVTAVGHGLDIWGRIVGVSRIISLPGTDFFGFKQAHERVFGHAPLYSRSHSSTTNFALSDDAFRLLILVKALSNISNSSIISFNRILMLLFPNRGNAFVTDTGDMTERLNFEFTLQPFELAILKQSGAFSPPTGVKLNILAANPKTTWGFRQGNYQTFGHGSLWNGFL